MVVLKPMLLTGSNLLPAFPHNPGFERETGEDSLCGPQNGLV